MKAVNLIPAEERKGAGGAAGRSGGAAYVLVGTLALLVILAGVWASTGKTIADREAEVVRLERDAANVESRAAALAPYTLFNQLRVNRTQTVRSLAASRFDWSHLLGELARVIPSDVELTSLTGTVAQDSATGGGTAAGSTLRGAIPGPALEMAGCAPSHVSVARMVVRMRLIDGVKRVSLQGSVKSGDSGASSGSSSGSSGSAAGCTGQDLAAFTLVVFLNQVAPPGTPAAAAAAPPAAAAPATGGVPQPASAVTPPALSGETK